MNSLQETQADRTQLYEADGEIQDLYDQQLHKIDRGIIVRTGKGIGTAVCFRCDKLFAGSANSPLACRWHASSYNSDLSMWMCCHQPSLQAEPCLSNWHQSADEIITCVACSKKMRADQLNEHQHKECVNAPQNPLSSKAGTTTCEHCGSMYARSSNKIISCHYHFGQLSTQTSCSPISPLSTNSIDSPRKFQLVGKKFFEEVPNACILDKKTQRWSCCGSEHIASDPHSNGCSQDFHLDIHRLLECDCGESVEAVDMAAHKAKCSGTTSCSYCGRTGLTAQTRSAHHQDECAKYPYVKCPNASSGCTHTMIRNTIPFHTATDCPYALLVCPFAYVGCLAKFPRHDKSKHLVDPKYMPFHMGGLLEEVLYLRHRVGDLEQKLGIEPSTRRVCLDQTSSSRSTSLSSTSLDSSKTNSNNNNSLDIYDSHQLDAGVDSVPASSTYRSDYSIPIDTKSSACDDMHRFADDPEFGVAFGAPPPRSSSRERRRNSFAGLEPNLCDLLPAEERVDYLDCEALSPNGRLRY